MLTDLYSVNRLTFKNLTTPLRPQIKITVKRNKPSCIALLISKRSGMTCVNEGSHVLSATHAFIHKWNEPYLPLLTSRTASLHFGWYSFPVLVRVGGRVGPSGSVKYWGGLPARRRSVTHPSISHGGRESSSRVQRHNTRLPSQRPNITHLQEEGPYTPRRHVMMITLKSCSNTANCILTAAGDQQQQPSRRRFRADGTTRR